MRYEWTRTDTGEYYVSMSTKDKADKNVVICDNHKEKTQKYTTLQEYQVLLEKYRLAKNKSIE